MKNIKKILLLFCVPLIVFSQSVSSFPSRLNGNVVNYNMTVLTSTTEAITTLTLTNGVTYNQRVVYSILLPDLKAGAKIIVTAQAEVTSELSYNVGFGRFIKIGDSYRDSTFTGYVTKPCEDNFSAAKEHHYVTTPSMVYTLTSDMSGKYLLYVIYAVSSSYISGDKLTVEQGYGHLSCLIVTP